MSNVRREFVFTVAAFIALVALMSVAMNWSGSLPAMGTSEPEAPSGD
jgi:hypothetical protein